ncbi:hypothetical protein [Streptacidiphilus sp. PAMC 29251]
MTNTPGDAAATQERLRDVAKRLPSRWSDVGRFSELAAELEAFVAELAEAAAVRRDSRTDQGRPPFLTEER